MTTPERGRDPSDLRAKFRGALLGVGVGDGLGARLEGAVRVSGRELERIASGTGTLRYTDDTHMTIGVAESLLECGGFDGARMAARFVQDFSAEPWRGYGAGPPRVFALLSRGVAWDQAGRTLFGGRGSFGNGAAMRVAPVALFAFPDLDLTAELARRTAVITHTHELGIEGAVLQAVAVGAALQRSPSAPLEPGPFLEQVRRHLRSRPFLEKLDLVGSLLEEGVTEGDVVSRLGNGIEAPESVPTALFAFLGNATSFPAAVRYAIGLGGDTDTIGSMTGALAGAYLGAKAIPQAWRDRLEGQDRLRDLADALWERVGGRWHPT